MASAERDHSIADATLELADTRPIARSLSFAGYGVECSKQSSEFYSRIVLEAVNIDDLGRQYA
jgi:hypothetical protein